MSSSRAGELNGQSAREGVVEALRDSIISGKVPPGARIREAEIAERLGVSRTPVREAFLVLAVEGLLSLQSGRGARVRVYKAEDVRLVHEVRSLVEGCVARFATDRISNQQLTSLEESCARLEALPNGAVQECNEENILFHNTLFFIVGSDRLMHIGRHLLEVPLPYKENYWANAEQKRCSEMAHRRILEALKARDGAAAETAMREHVLEAGAYITAWMDEAGHISSAPRAELPSIRPALLDDAEDTHLDDVRVGPSIVPTTVPPHRPGPGRWRDRAGHGRRRGRTAGAGPPGRRYRRRRRA